MIASVTVFCGSFIKPEFLDLWYPAPDVDALLRDLESYEPHRYGSKWTGRGR